MRGDFHEAILDNIWNYVMITGQDNRVVFFTKTYGNGHVEKCL